MSMIWQVGTVLDLKFSNLKQNTFSVIKSITLIKGVLMEGDTWDLSLETFIMRWASSTET